MQSLVEGSVLQARIGCAAQIFGDVDDHAVRPEGNDEILLPEGIRLIRAG
jgi:hypothetical protein